MASETIGKYTLLSRLAEGGMAEIFLCKTSGTFEKRFVMKRILPSLASDKAFVDLFLDEVRVAATLQHAHLAQVFDFGMDGDAPYLVMELLHGHDLRAIEDELDAGTRIMPVEHVVTIAIGVCAGLHHAHERRDEGGQSTGLVHRDVSPHNIFVTLEGDVKLCDFGIAKSAAQRNETNAGTVKGKLRYLSPEQARAERVDRRTDLFALSVVLWELLTGRDRFSGSELQILNAVTTEPSVRPSTIRPDVPPGLEAIVMRNLALRREERYSTAQEMQLALEAWARDERIPISAVGLGAWVRELVGEPLSEVATAGGTSVGSKSSTPRTSHVDVEHPEFRLPHKLELTGVSPDDGSSRARGPSAQKLSQSTSFSRAEPAVALPEVAPDDPPLELDRPASVPVPQVVPSRRSPIVPFVALLAIAAGGFFGWRMLAARMKPGANNASVDLVNVPTGAKLLLDGGPIEGHHLVLVRSTEVHAVQVTTKGKAHVVQFVVDGDKTVDLAP